MDSTDAVGGEAEDVLQRRTQDSSLAGPASQTREEWNDDSYSMKKDNMMGHVIIFNNRKVDRHFKLRERFGTDIDAMNMEKLFSTIGFKVTIIKDATKAEMIKTMDKVSKEDHSSNNCFICIILSHAVGNRVVYGTDTQVKVDDLMSKVKGHNCPSLAGKPKVFFVQACLNDHREDDDSDSGSDECEPDEEAIVILPLEADFFLFESLVPGSYAWKKDRNKGSWFIQAVYDVFSSGWKKRDVHSMCTKVMAKVSDLLTEDGKEDKPPLITTQLRKELILFV